MTHEDHNLEHLAEDDPQTDSSQETSISSAMHPGLKVLVLALVASAVVHLSPLIGALVFDLSLFDQEEVKLDWFGPQDDLTSLGHGGTWAKVSAPPKKEELKAEEPPKEEPKEEPPKEVEVKEEPQKEPPKPQPKPKKPKPKPLAKIKVKPKPKKPKEPPKPKPKPKTTSTQQADTTRVTGLAESGPSNLPTFKNYAPGNARMMALIRLKALRGTPYQKPLTNLLESLPDYRILLDPKRHGALDSIDSIFLASANPRYLQHTFLAVRHTLNESGVKDALDARFPGQIPWNTHKGYPARDLIPSVPGYQDPRRILLVNDSLAIVTRPEWLAQLTAKPAPKQEGDPDQEQAALPMLDGLSNLDAIASDETLVQLSVQRLRFYIPGMGKLPSFQTARMKVVGVKSSTITLDVQFASKEHASSFAQTCPKLKRRIISSIPMAAILQLDKYVNRFTCLAKDEYTTISATYSQAEMLRLIQLASPFIPRPPALANLPTPPPLSPKPITQAADMGIAASPDMGSLDQGPSEKSTTPAQDAGTDTPDASAQASGKPALSSKDAGSTPPPADALTTPDAGITEADAGD